MIQMKVIVILSIWKKAFTPFKNKNIYKKNIKKWHASGTTQDYGEQLPTLQVCRDLCNIGKLAERMKPNLISWYRLVILFDRSNLS